MSLTEAELRSEGDHATKLLQGKVVSHVVRAKETVVLVEFTDGTRLFVDRSSDGVELSIS